MINIFRKRIDRLIHGDDGAALVVTLALFMMMYISCAGVFAIGKTVKEKMILQNAADAAAYSAAIVQADTLSRIATLNREMAWVYKSMVCLQMDYIVYSWLKDAKREYDTCPEDPGATSIGNITFRGLWPMLAHTADGYAYMEAYPGKIKHYSEIIEQLNAAIEDLLDNYENRIDTVVEGVLLANLPDNYSKDCYWCHNVTSLADLMRVLSGSDEERFLEFIDEVGNLSKETSAYGSSYEKWFPVGGDLKHVCKNYTISFSERSFFFSQWLVRKGTSYPYPYLGNMKPPDNFYWYDHSKEYDKIESNPAKPHVLEKKFFYDDDGGIRRGAISVGVAKCNRNPWEGIVKVGLDGKKRGLYEVFQPLIGAIDWTWAISSAQAGYIDSRSFSGNARRYSYVEHHDYTVDWDRDGDWNLRTDNWDAVYVPVCKSFAEDDFASWIKGDWKVLSNNPASDLPAYSPDTMTKALPQMHNAGMPYAPLDWGGLLGKIYH